MKLRNTILCIACAAILLMCASLPGLAEAEQDRSAEQALIERIVINYAANGVRDDEALAELNVRAPEKGGKWARIMDLWQAPVNVLNALPDGLPEDDTLCLVALGFQLNADGTMREELIERLQVVLAAARKYPQAVILCTGGPTAADAPEATEGDASAAWLTDNGVDPARIVVENRSLTTAQNAIYGFGLLKAEQPQVTQMAIISSDYHIATGVLLFGAESILRDAGIDIVSNAAWTAPSGSLSAMFQAGALIELSGDSATAFEIYYDNYDIHELPDLIPADDGDDR